jgi:tetratricopeptide (TPR) repeat protein
MSMNVLSWQNIVIGDPLYQPFKTTTISKDKMKIDRDYKLIRYAQSKFPDEKTRYIELIKAAEKTKSGTVYEMVGFRSLELENYGQAIKSFARAKQLFTNPADRLRQDLHLIEIERRQKNTEAALKILKKAKSEFKDIPEAKALDGLLTILDPPAPPATKRKK